MISIASIRAATAAHYRVRERDLRGKRGMAPVSNARQVGLYLSRRLTVRSLRQIGWQFGHRHHTTVMHAERVVGTRLRSDRQLRRDVRAIWKALEGEGT